MVLIEWPDRLGAALPPTGSTSRIDGGADEPTAGALTAHGRRTGGISWRRRAPRARPARDPGPARRWRATAGCSRSTRRRPRSSWRPARPTARSSAAETFDGRYRHSQELLPAVDAAARRGRPALRGPRGRRRGHRPGRLHRAARRHGDGQDPRPRAGRPVVGISTSEALLAGRDAGDGAVAAVRAARSRAGRAPGGAPASCRGRPGRLRRSARMTSPSTSPDVRRTPRSRRDGARSRRCLASAAPARRGATRGGRRSTIRSGSCPLREPAARRHGDRGPKEGWRGRATPGSPPDRADDARRPAAPSTPSSGRASPCPGRTTRIATSCARTASRATWWRAPAMRSSASRGLWVMVDEAHVTTFAVDPRWRRRGVGERLLLGLLDIAVTRRAREATLEVRLSNMPARRLYEKYGFRPVGIRPRYYSDNGEDALIMTTDPLDSPARCAIGSRRSARRSTSARSTDDDPDRAPRWRVPRMSGGAAGRSCSRSSPRATRPASPWSRTAAGSSSNVVASQVALHAPAGGIVPEVAARAHLRWILPVLDEAWQGAGASWADVGAVAVTRGPGPGRLAAGRDQRREDARLGARQAARRRRTTSRATSTRRGCAIRARRDGRSRRSRWWRSSSPAATRSSSRCATT